MDPHECGIDRFNRLIDRDHDARNPRTAQREIPAGVLGVNRVRLLVLLSSTVFCGAAWALSGGATTTSVHAGRCPR